MDEAQQMGSWKNVTATTCSNKREEKTMSARSSHYDGLHNARFLIYIMEQQQKKVIDETRTKESYKKKLLCRKDYNFLFRSLKDLVSSIRA